MLTETRHGQASTLEDTLETRATQPKTLLLCALQLTWVSNEATSCWAGLAIWAWFQGCFSTPFTLKP